jgi:hypothetical protein
MSRLYKFLQQTGLLNPLLHFPDRGTEVSALHGGYLQSQNLLVQSLRRHLSELGYRANTGMQQQSAILAANAGDAS